MGLTWDLVQEIQVGPKRFSAAEFLAVAKNFASTPPTLSSLSADANLHSAPSTTVVQRTVVSALNRVHSLELEAIAANWDRDAETDGIALRVLPLGLDRRVLAVDGVISVQLVGREFVTGRSDQEFPLLGQWSQRVRSTDFRGQEGAIYQLPISRQHDHELNLLSIGMVQGRLQATGQGHFEATAPTRLRPYNPIRDQLNEHHLHYDAFGRYRGRHW
jgi:hypothetical protein